MNARLDASDVIPPGKPTDQQPRMIEPMLSTIPASQTHRPDVNAAAGQWASERIWGRPDGFRHHCSITVARRGIVVAVVVLHDWRPGVGVIELSAAGSGAWQSRRIWNEIFSTCFDALGCQTVCIRTASTNAPVISQTRRLGFSHAVLPNMRGPGVDEWVFTLTREQWHAGRIYKPT